MKGKLMKVQKVFFDGEMRPVAEVSQIWLDNGKDRDYIFRWIGFRLGLDQFDEVQSCKLS